MNDYCFTSKMFKGNLHFTYEEGVLMKFVNEAELSSEQLIYLQKNFPFVEDELPKIAGKSGKIEQIVDVSFDRFWAIYDKRVNKKRCEELWYKLQESTRQQCLSRIKKYQIFCKTHNRVMKDPDTYLRNRGWEDELY